MKVIEKATILLKDNICDNCLGRGFAGLLSGLTNKQRGKIIRQLMAFLIDSGEKIDVDPSNFYGIKFRNVKIKPKKPKKCKICKNFFLDKINELAKKIIKKVSEYEFNTFLIGTILPSDLIRAEELIWDLVGIEFVEPMKSEINRELGKTMEKLTGKKFSLKLPDITVIVNLETNRIDLEVRNLYVYGKYQKLVRGIPQTKWICKSEKKFYKTSVQEIIEKPFLKATKAKESKMHAAGREDIDTRCLAKRPFVIELINPVKRSIDLKKIQTQINKSKKVKVNRLKIATKTDVREVKFSRYDKTYLAEIAFENKIDRKKLKFLKSLKDEIIYQKTPTHVSHRRSFVRKRKLKKIDVKQVGKRKLELKVRCEAGFDVKEFITGDDGRTKPNVSDSLDNKVKKIKLDVIKIYD